MSQLRAAEVRALPPRLLAVSPGQLGPPGGEQLLMSALDRMKEAGLEGVLLREPHASDRMLFDLAAKLRDRGFSWIGIHDRAHLAIAPQFDGVHLGFRSLSPRSARAILPPEVTVGFSAHLRDDLSQIDADYVFYSPVFSPSSKESDALPLGLEELRRACSIQKRPRLWALGGLEVDRVGSVVECGVEGLASIGGLFAAADPAAAVEGFLRAWSESES